MVLSGGEDVVMAKAVTLVIGMERSTFSFVRQFATKSLSKKSSRP